MLNGFAMLLVDDHPLFREGLLMALQHQAPGMHVTAVATVKEALDAMATADGNFDLVLLDYGLPGTDGLRCAADLMQQYPDVGVGLISGRDDPSLPSRAQEAGLLAYLPKSLELTVLLECLQTLERGQPVFHPVATTVSPTLGKSAALPLELTPRQFEVLQAVIDGSSNKEIARSLGISPATVKKHLESIFRRLGVTNRLQAVMLTKTLLQRDEWS